MKKKRRFTFEINCIAVAKDAIVYIMLVVWDDIRALWGVVHTVELRLRVCYQGLLKNGQRS